MGGARRVLDRYWERANEIVSSSAFREALDVAASLLWQTYERGAMVVTVGNGGSASTASHFAADLAKYATADRADLRAVCLNDNVAGLSAWTNDASWSECYDRPVMTWLREGGGLLCAFSVHGGSLDTGVSDNLFRAARAAKGLGNRVLAFTGFDGGRLATLADVLVNVPVDEEPVATPLIESVHVMAHHFLCLALRSRVVAP